MGDPLDEATIIGPMISRDHLAKVRRYICSVLAGYAWDESNPFVARGRQRLHALAELCRSEAAAMDVPSAA